MDGSDQDIGGTAEARFLMERVEAALTLGAECSSGRQIPDDDHFGFMAIHFLCKQMDHAESVQMLVPRRDCCLVARTMIDGLYQLLWTSHDPAGRALRWRSFAVISDWRLIREQIASGLSVDKDVERRTEARLEEFRDIHLNKRAKVSSSDKFHNTWRGDTSLSKMASSVGRELYDTYSELSDWEHWGVRGIGGALSRDGDSLHFQSNSERIACQSLVVAFQCLMQVIKLIDSHFKLGKVEIIASMNSEFDSRMEGFRSKAAPPVFDYFFRTVSTCPVPGLRLMVFGLKG